MGSSSGEPHANLSVVKQAYLAIEDLERRLAAVSKAQHQPIAVVGIGCRFPGGANDPATYWKLLREGYDAVSEIPADRWDADAYYDPDRDAPGKMTTRAAGFLKDVDVRAFDAAFFGIAPREAVSMDPQQRLLLEVTWEALEHAAIAPERLAASRTGVFVGISGNGAHGTLALDAAGREGIDAFSGTGNIASVAAGRLSYVLGLEGPCFPVDTACSSSLVTTHLACQSLRLGECDVALVAGVNLILAPTASVYFSKLRATSDDGRCKAFDESADGYGRGEGCGVVVLKRLADAEADGDRILGRILGTAINHDGRSNGLTAPSGPAQQAVLRAALRDAGVEPSEVSYIEAHGTGTPLGDPIEIGSLAAVYGQGRSRDLPLHVASVKTNIGHLEAAAGIAGLIKTILALDAGEIPGHLHLNRVSPYISLDAIPAIVPTTLTPWPTVERRLAGVSSFGFSGTNAHVIVEAAPRRGETGGAPASRRSHALLTLSSRTPGALTELGGRIEAHVGQHPELDLERLCHTLQVGRSHQVHRLAIVARTGAELADRLRRWRTDDAGAGITTGEVFSGAKLAFGFPGEAPVARAQVRALLAEEPVFAQAWQRCAELAATAATTVAIDADGDSHGAVELFALEFALGRLWSSWGVTPSYLLGAGAGEYAAACIAGVLSLEDAVALACARDQVFESGSPEDSLAAFARAASAVRAASPKLPLVSSLTGIPFGTDALPDSAYWVEQLGQATETKSVRVPAALGIDLVLEFAPAAKPAGRSPEPETTPIVAGFPSGDSPAGQLLESLAMLYARGVKVDWRNFAGRHVPRLALPTYPWQRKVFWFDRAETATVGSRQRPRKGSPSSPSGVPRVNVTADGVRVDSQTDAQSTLQADAERDPMRMTADQTETAVVPAESPAEGAGQYYDLASRSARSEQRELASERFAPLDQVIPGFSWLMAIHRSAQHQEHLDTIVEAQREYRRKAFAGIDFSALIKALDFGCGNGFDLLDLALANPHLRLDGFNISGEEVDTCSRRIRERGLRERVRVYHRDSVRDELPDQYDLAFGFQVVHNIPIERRAELFANIAAHLVPGGLLVLGDYLVAGASPLSHDQASSYIATQAQWVDHLSVNRLRISRVVDIGREVANFFDDPEFESNLAAILREQRLDPMLVAGLRMYDALGTLLRKGLVRYVLLLAERERFLNAEEIARHNRARLEPLPESASTSTPGLREALRAADPEQRRARLQRLLTEQVARALGLPENELDARLPLSQAGLSSLMAAEVQAYVETQLGLELPVAELLDGPSIERLAGRLSDALTAAGLRPESGAGASGEMESLDL